MGKKKKIYGLLVFCLVVGVIFKFTYYLPSVTYLRGKLMAKMSKSPKTLGLTLLQLPVEFHRQEHALSCEIAALKMALNSQGVNVTETELLGKLNFDRAPFQNGVWGDPYIGFVGNIDGKMGITGYGVYWQPVADVVSLYTYAEVIENATPSQLAKHLSQRRPIVWWGYYGRGRKIYWRTPEGRQIDAVLGEHARVITGFVGTVEEPFGFYLMDPIYGELFWETEELLKNSAPFSNSGVVVYAPEELFKSAPEKLR